MDQGVLLVLGALGECSRSEGRDDAQVASVARIAAADSCKRPIGDKNTNGVAFHNDETDILDVC